MDYLRFGFFSSQRFGWRQVVNWGGSLIDALLWLRLCRLLGLRFLLRFSHLSLCCTCRQQHWMKINVNIYINDTNTINVRSDRKKSSSTSVNHKDIQRNRKDFLFSSLRISIMMFVHSLEDSYLLLSCLLLRRLLCRWELRIVLWEATNEHPKRRLSSQRAQSVTVDVVIGIEVVSSDELRWIGEGWNQVGCGGDGRQGSASHPR